MYDEPTSLESPSVLDSLLGLARGGVSIYREATSPLPVASLPAVTRPGVVTTMPWYKRPLVWAGAAVLLLLGVLLVRRK